jgi:hypothetical protein
MRDKPALFLGDIPFSRSGYGFIPVVHATKIVKVIEKVLRSSQKTITTVPLSDITIGYIILLPKCLVWSLH